MTMREEYEAYLKKREAMEKHPMGRVWINQVQRYVHPFQIYGNLYYVGDNWVCVHIIDTGDGLLMIDAGNCGGTPMLIQAIWEMGFNPADVKWIVLSHGHVDHIGAVNFFKSMFGSRIYMGVQDAEMFEKNPELALIHESTDYEDSLFVPDVVIHDGDKIKSGNTELEFYEVPGHTAGCIAFFGDVTDGREAKRVGYYGGFGFNTLTKAFLEEIGDPEFKMRQTYLNSIDKVKDQHVDIFMGNHTNNNQTLERHQYMVEHPGENPFIDTEIWNKYLNEKRADLVKFMADPKNN